MNEDLKKNMGIILVLLEIILAGCFVLLSFIYGFWIDTSSSMKIDKINRWLTGMEHQAIIFIAALLASWLIHKLNIYWINKTGFGSKRNAFIFSAGIFILIFLAGLTGVILFILQRPLE